MAEGVGSLYESELMDDLKKSVFQTQLGKCTNELVNYESMHKSSTRSKQTKFYHGGGEVA